MTVDISLIPQERVQDLISTLDNIQNGLSNNLVHKSGTETISGEKTFTGDYLNIKNTTENIKLCLRKTSTTGQAIIVARDGDADNAWRSGIYFNNQNDSTGHSINFNTTSLNGPTPSASNSTSSTNIATVGWINDPTKSTNVVHRSGDEEINGTKTFTEWLLIKRNYTSTDRDNRIKEQWENIKLANDEALPSNSVFSGAHYFDGNNFEYGTHYSAIDTSGNVSTMLWVHHPNGNAAQLGIYQNSSGDTWTYAPPCSSNNSIVTTTGISKAENGYVKYGNGIIAQWGYVAVSASTIADKSYTINLNTPFTSSNYYVNGTFKYTASTSNWGAGCPGVSAKTTSNFTIIADGINSSHPISGVYWFAYGY